MQKSAAKLSVLEPNVSMLKVIAVNPLPHEQSGKVELYERERLLGIAMKIH